ncbi:MAG: hypothetical protein ACRDT4_21705 [Micromonosporaceae bacterium]
MATDLRERVRRAGCWRVVAVLVVPMVMLVGCTGRGAGMQPTETVAEASERVEALLKEAIAQLPAAAMIEDPQQADGLPCDDPTDGGPRGRVIVEYDYAIAGLASEDYPRHFDTLQTYWEDRGYRKIEFYKDGPHWWLKYTDSDGYRIILGTGFDGSNLWIRSSSPCVWPNGTPEPVS